MLQVYPRWRGEHKGEQDADWDFSGLSPLARGTLLNQCAEFEVTAVYPRWRGEHTINPILDFPLNGLSPLARGTPTHSVGVALTARFIPAGAGNTAEHIQCRPMAAVYPRWRGEHWSLAE